MPRPRTGSVDIARNVIIKRIESFELPSGAVVSDLELSKELDMSRTPVRESILQLINSGLLVRENSKVVVKPITLADIDEILQLREAIETVSVKSIIQNGGISAKEKRQLEGVQGNLSQGIINGDFHGNFSSDALFHHKLVEFSKNQRMIDVCDQIDLQSRRLRWLTILTPQRYNDTCNEHSRILECVENGDVHTAQQAICAHIEQTRKNYESILHDNKWETILIALNNIRSQ